MFKGNEVIELHLKWKESSYLLAGRGDGVKVVSLQLFSISVDGRQYSVSHVSH